MPKAWIFEHARLPNTPKIVDQAAAPRSMRNVVVASHMKPEVYYTFYSSLDIKHHLLCRTGSSATEGKWVREQRAQIGRIERGESTELLEVVHLRIRMQADPMENSLRGTYKLLR